MKRKHRTPARRREVADEPAGHSGLITFPAGGFANLYFKILQVYVLLGMIQDKPYVYHCFYFVF